MRGLTLEAVLTHVARTSPSLQAARDGARSSHEGVPLALSAWLPTIQASGSHAWADRDSRTSVEGHQETRSAELSYTHNLYRGGADSAALRRAEAETAYGHAVVEDTEQTLLLRAATAYLDVIRAERTITLRETALAAFEARAGETETRFRIGERTRADLAQAEAEQEIAVAELVAAKADLKVRRALFEQIVGLPPDDLEPPREPAGLPDTLEAGRRKAMEEHPSVQAATHALRAAEHAVPEVAGEIKPRIDLTGRLAWTDQRGFGAFADEATDARVMLRVTVPFYQGGSTGARLRQAMHVHAQRKNELFAVKRAAAQRATAAWHELHAARQRHAAFQAGVAASRAALDGIRREAEVGERTTREILDAERNLVSRQVSALSAERNVIDHAYTLLAAVGALAVRRLMIEGVPNLGDEARETRGKLAPGILSLRLHRDWAESVPDLGDEARETRGEPAGAMLLRLHEAGNE